MMLDKEFWATISVVASGIGALLTGISNLIKVLRPEKKQLPKPRRRRIK